MPHDHDYTDVPVCPKCGHRFEAFQADWDNGDECCCPECGTDIVVAVHVSVTYSTEVKA